MYIWKTLKVFVSSTYKDLEQERDALAAMFQQLQQHVFHRRLHLIPYDMRWRDAHEQDLVQWCLETVRDCDYFIGILGYRYGWRPPLCTDGSPNHQRLSITEMEINQALQTIPKHRRLFCFGDMSQYTQNQLATETAEDLASLERLKQRLLAQGETVTSYTQGDTVPVWLHEQLSLCINQDYPAGQQAQLESYRRRDALLEIMEEKLRGFVGQQEHLAYLEQFCLSTSSNNYLAMQAVAGTGKSALLAAFLHQWKQTYPNIPVVAHFMSMAGDSRSVTGVMQSLGEQLQELGLLAEELDPSPDQLIFQVQNALQTITQPTILALDGLDEMNEEGHDLSWLPRWLGPHLRIILTTRPVEVWQHLQTFPQLQTLHLPPLEDKYIRAIIQFYRDKQQLPISPGDENILVQRAAGSPLFLKVALDEMVAGGVAVGQLASTVDALFRQILERLQLLYGTDMIFHYLGWIAASRSGLVEIELRELLTSTFPSLATEDFLLRIQRSFANFVIQREKLLNFFHPEFARTVKMLLGKSGMRQYHRQLAAYLQNKGYRYERTLEELPYQLQWSEQYPELMQLFGNIRFLEAKCVVGMVADLHNDLAFALDSLVVAIPPHLQVELAPDIELTPPMLRLLMRSLDFDFHFLTRHPQCLFQTLWNRGYWHDSPRAAPHYPEHSQTPWQLPGPKLSTLVEWWRAQLPPTQPWLQTLRPLPDRLDTSMRRIFRGHQDLVTSICMNREGSFLVSGSWDRTIRIWDTHNGQCLRVLHGHQDFLSSVCLTPDEKRIISGSGDGTVRVWNVQTGQCLQTWQAHDKPVATVACHPNGTIVASGSKDKTIRLWDLATHQCLHTLEGHQKVINSVCFQADGTRLVSGAWDNTVRIWDIATGQCLQVLEGHADDVKCVSVSTDGHKIFSASKDQTVRIWDAHSGQCLHQLPHQGTVFSVEVTQDGKSVVTGDYGTLRTWDVETGHLLAQQEGHESAIYSLSLDAKAHIAATCSGDKTIRIWEIEQTQQTMSLDAHRRLIRAVCLDHNEEWAYTASKDHTIRVWHVPSGTAVAQLSEHQGAVSCLSLSHDGKALASGSADHTIRIWNLSSRTCQQILLGHTKHITSVYLHPNGVHAVSGSRGHNLRLWDLSTGQCFAQMFGHNDDIRALFWHPNGRWIVSGAEDRTVKLWDVATQTCLQTFVGHLDGVLSVGLSEDGQTVLSSSRDNTLRYWNASTGQCFHTLEGRGEVQSLAFPYYTLARDIETVLVDSHSHQTIAAFPSILRQASTTPRGILYGFAGTHLLLAKLQNAPS